MNLQLCMHRFDDIDYVDTLKSLKLRYDQMHERGDGEGGTGAADGEPNSNNGAEGSTGAAAGIRGRTFAFTAGGDPIPGGGGGPRGGPPARRRKPDVRGLDEEEEDYFSTEDDVSLCMEGA